MSKCDRIALVSACIPAVPHVAAQSIPPVGSSGANSAALPQPLDPNNSPRRSPQRIGPGRLGGRRRLGAIGPMPAQGGEPQGAGLAPVCAAEAVPAVRAGTGAGLWIEFAAPPSAELLAATLAALHSLQRTSC